MPSPGRRDDSDGDTSSYQKIPSEHNIPTDLFGFIVKEIRGVRADIAELTSLFNESRYLVKKHDDQIVMLAKDFAEYEREHTKRDEDVHRDIERRVLVLEQREQSRLEAAKLEAEQDQKSTLTKLKDSAVSEFGRLITYGVVLLVIWLLIKYAKEQP